LTDRNEEDRLRNMTELQEARAAFVEAATAEGGNAAKGFFAAAQVLNVDVVEAANVLLANGLVSFDAFERRVGGKRVKKNPQLMRFTVDGRMV
jgi:hypothetical protein